MQKEQLKQLLSDGLNSFPELLQHLKNDTDIDSVEELEDVVKQIIFQAYRKGINGEVARKIAKFQQDIGLLLKYKSYTIKCATPLGFSIFLHNAREGFSFQQHQTHKTELFHILTVKKGGFVFLCSMDQWLQYYDPIKFKAWLEGEINPTYEQFAFRPEPGDVFVVDKVGVVHTVVGCELEEFANDSTDMVDRLHDQNQYKTIPTKFNRAFATKLINQLSLPKSNRLIVWDESGFHIQSLSPKPITGGEKTTYAEIDFSAARMKIDPGESSEMFVDSKNATNLFFHSGSGNIVVADRNELESGQTPTVKIGPKQDIIITPGVYWQVQNTGITPMEFSEHKVPIEMAFHKFVN